MKTLFQHVERVKEKPHHVRRRVAFATALGGTAVIALVWFVGTVSTGVFALQNSSFADSQGQSLEVRNADQRYQSGGLAGVAAAPASRQPAHIEIVDGAVATSSKRQAEPTIIPF